MTAHAVIALYLGAVAAGVLSGVIAYEVRDARRVIREAPVPTRIVASNVRRIDSGPVVRRIGTEGRR